MCPVHRSGVLLDGPLVIWVTGDIRRLSLIRNGDSARIGRAGRFDVGQTLVSEPNVSCSPSSWANAMLCPKPVGVRHRTAGPDALRVDPAPVGIGCILLPGRIGCDRQIGPWALGLGTS